MSNFEYELTEQGITLMLENIIDDISDDIKDELLKITVKGLVHTLEKKESADSIDESLKALIKDLGTKLKRLRKLEDEAVMADKDYAKHKAKADAISKVHGRLCFAYKLCLLVIETESSCWLWNPKGV